MVECPRAGTSSVATLIDKPVFGHPGHHGAQPGATGCNWELVLTNVAINGRYQAVLFWRRNRVVASQSGVTTLVDRYAIKAAHWPKFRSSHTRSFSRCCPEIRGVLRCKTKCCLRSCAKLPSRHSRWTPSRHANCYSFSTRVPHRCGTWLHRMWGPSALK